MNRCWRGQRCEEMHVYGGGVCKANREAKEDLVGSG